MTDTFILLAPILLLAIVALLGFAGCGFSPAPFESISISPSSGPTTGGTSVTITGQSTAFKSGTGLTVSFGSAQSNSVTVTSDILLTATTPAVSNPGPVDVDLSYTDDYGAQTPGVPNGFTYYSPVTHLQTSVGTTGTQTVSVHLQPSPGKKLVVVTAIWGSNTTGGVVTLSGAGVGFMQIGSQSRLNPHEIVNFYANGADLSAGLTINANLTVAPNSSPFTIFASGYDDADPMNPPDNPVQTALPFVGSPTLPFSTNALSAGDLIYAVAVARNNASGLVGTVTPGQAPTFTAEDNSQTGILIEDYDLQPSDLPPAQNMINVSATQAAATRWFTFAMRIRHA